MTILDYSTGLPTTSTIKNAGYSGAIRYLRKNGASSITYLTGTERTDFANTGLDLGLIYEAPSGNRMLDGYAAGRDDAFWALEQTKHVVFLICARYISPAILIFNLPNMLSLIDT